MYKPNMACTFLGALPQLQISLRLVYNRPMWWLLNESAALSEPESAGRGSSESVLVSEFVPTSHGVHEGAFASVFLFFLTSFAMS